MRLLQATVAGLSALGWACGGSGVITHPEPTTAAPKDAPLVAAQPGAWFDAHGNLTIVGAGRRLRLVLSAPIAACTPAFHGGGGAAEVSARASLPFHVLSEVCRDAHPTVLLAEESDTASPSELEHSYHEVARCAGVDWALTEGWVPAVVAASDPCPLALGPGWRLPTTQELQGLTIDDRKALAGALFDPDDRTAFSGLLMYARPPSGDLALLTVSPNAAEVAPALTEDNRQRSFFGATLRCVHGAGLATGRPPTPPALPYAKECLRAYKRAQGAPDTPAVQPLPELQKLKDWVELVQRTPTLLLRESSVQDLAQLLAAPALEDLARQGREERALTERYAELAEALDDPAVSAGERERRHAEFDHLRKRLGGQIVRGAQASARSVELGVVLSRLQPLVEAAAGQGKGTKKAKTPNYTPVLARIRELGGGKAHAP